MSSSIQPSSQSSAPPAAPARPAIKDVPSAIAFGKQVILPALAYPSRLWAAGEAAIILLSVYFYTWILLYLGLLVIALELGALIYRLVTNKPKPYANPQTVLITGASSGIGEGLALKYAETAKTLILTGRNKAKLDAIVATCAAAGKAKGNGALTVRPIIADVNDRAAMSAAIAALEAQTPIDLVIANAGVGLATTPDQYSWEDKIRYITDINVDGVFNTILPLAEAMKTRKRGQIAVVSSLAGVATMSYGYSYGASKALLNYFMVGFRSEMAAYNVGATVIWPGFVRSQLTTERHNKLRFGLPFFLETDRAAQLIVNGLADDVATIAFPFPMHLLSWIPHIVPQNLIQVIFDIFHYAQRAKAARSA